jgi:hypothetical protein
MYYDVFGKSCKVISHHNVIPRVNIMLQSLFIVLLSVLLSVNTMASAKKYDVIEWVDLIPQADLDALLNPPASITSIPHGFDSTLDQLSDAIDKGIEQSKKIPTPEEQAYSAALESTNVKNELANKNIRLPGFIVPVEYSDAQVITEFFLVPYFGACIHVPAPPPNQVVYVKYPKGLHLTALYDPFWIEGELKTEIKKNDIATAAYEVTADAIKPYEAYKQ